MQNIPPGGLDPKSWHLLPPDLVELQIGQIDLLMAMYPEDISLNESSQEMLDNLRNDTIEISSIHATMTSISLLLDLPISKPGEIPTPHKLHLDLSVPFTYTGDTQPEETPWIKVRIQQPPWLNRAATSRLVDQTSTGEDVLAIIDDIRQAASALLSQPPQTTTDDADTQIAEPLTRVWFYFPSISTRSKRDDFITHAPSYKLTGFLYAGKPGLLCVEGGSQSIDDYMKFIKTESWGDIPAHHKKVSERYREKCSERVFAEMTEITDLVGERRGQRVNRGDMKALEEWLVVRGLGEAFAKVLM